jgi:hypothetical protein
VIRPTPDSEIGFELWLPEVWNGRYLQTGNGGFAGLINYGGLVPGLRNRFAVASTDDGTCSGLLLASEAALARAQRIGGQLDFHNCGMNSRRRGPTS